MRTRYQRQIIISINKRTAQIDAIQIKRWWNGFLCWHVCYRCEWLPEKFARVLRVLPKDNLTIWFV